MKKFFESIPSPKVLIHNIGLKTPDEIIPTPAQTADWEHQERLTALEKAKFKEMSFNDFMKGILPKAPSIDFGNLSLLNFD